MAGTCKESTFSSLPVVFLTGYPGWLYGRIESYITLIILQAIKMESYLKCCRGEQGNYGSLFTFFSCISLNTKGGIDFVTYNDSPYMYTVRPLFKKIHNTVKHMNLPIVV